MGTKTVSIRGDVYERLRARKRDDESFSALLERLLEESEPDWEATFGTLSSEDTGGLEEVVARVRAESDRGHIDRQRGALEAFGEVTDEETNSE
ncbi:antitoxin VapB family protein [Natronobacterium gregoryi]|uniref:Antitoxin n=2 Tax=Natronobacterium gregoryi TaxID=44930 RepID=L0AIX5_NATGS|nr:antitoxin VapB family protein [Natronobacterium gregoryi]AFZ73404.1 hypothetical protein Natgr_2227 [Natronobacterium gregoryi SP2]ELY68600.1 hypothetical protein C490_09283 [Natronobacterium gregoryi SP2]PLK19681.1 hypothetical protein CYV19_13760 [Natronobacterium gregoryi SP2]SFI72943.1 Predicted antitoxin, CopG family [Natronobacterium gregoryi]